MQFQVPPQLGEMYEQPNPESPLPGTGRRDEDLLGQQGNNQQAYDPTDYSSRTLQTIATLRQAITKRGGQPK